MKWIVIGIIGIGLIVGFQNCASGSGSDDPAPLSFSAGSIGFYINGVRTVVTSSPLPVKIGDKLRFESSLPGNQGFKTKFTLFTDCFYSETIQDWSDSLNLDLEYIVKAEDQTSCTSFNLWVRNTASTEPWPIATDVQESLLLNVVN